jgi:hypothetical protein
MRTGLVSWLHDFHAVIEQKGPFRDDLKDHTYGSPVLAACGCQAHKAVAGAGAQRKAQGEPLVSRELDAKVHLLLFGPWDESRCRVCAWPIAKSIEEGCVVGNCSMRPLPSHRADEPARYSTDIGVCMEQVWPKLTMPVLQGGEPVICQYFKGDMGWLEVEADTPAEAICRAFLAAKEKGA